MNDNENVDPFQARENLRRQLWAALRSRVLTFRELQQSAEFGSMLNVPAVQKEKCWSIESYNVHGKQFELIIAYQIQTLLRMSYDTKEHSHG